MKAGKSIGKKSAATSKKKELRGKRAPLPSKGTTKKSSPPASAKEAAPGASSKEGVKAAAAPSPRKKSAPAPPVSPRKTSVKKKAVAAMPEKGLKPGVQDVPKVRKKTASRPKAAAAKKTAPTKAGVKKRKAFAKGTRREEGVARARRRKTPAALPDASFGEAAAAAPPKKKVPARRKKKAFPVPYRSDLPREYGEDDITAIVVDPHEVFAHWEIREDHVAGPGKKLVLRLQDAEPGGNGSHPRTEDIIIHTRVGSGFFPLVKLGGYVVLSMGTMGPGGRFRPIVSTGRLTIPAAMAPEEDEPRGEASPSDRPGY